MKLLKPVNEESFFDFEEWCKKCDDFHSPIDSCKDMKPKQAKYYLDNALKEFNKKMYFVELEKFRNLFE